MMGDVVHEGNPTHSKGSISDTVKKEKFLEEWKRFGRLNTLVKSKNIEVLKDVLSTWRRTRRTSEKLDKALLTAAREGVKEAIGPLLEHGASPSYRDNLKNNCLMLVFKNCEGDVDLIRLILRHCRDRKEAQELIEDRGHFGYSALMYAVRFQHSEVLKEFLKFGIAINDLIKIEGGMIYAASRKDCLLLDVLVEANCDVNQCGEDSKTALIHAIRKRCLHCIEKLMAGGADVNIADENGSTPLMYAASVKSSENYDIVESLLEKGADVNSRNNVGTTPLLCAVSRSRHEDIAVLLLDQGADPNVINIRNRNPLLIATANNQLKVVKKLLEKGCDINYKEPCGNNVLTEAIMCESYGVFDEIMKYFDPKSSKEHQVKPTLSLDQYFKSAMTANKGYTPLTAAVYMRNPDFVYSLLKCGADPNGVDYERCTPLTMAMSICTRGWFHFGGKILTHLLRFGADPNKKANIYASFYGNKKLYLLESPLKLSVLFGYAGFLHMLWAGGCSIEANRNLCDTNIPWLFAEVPGYRYLFPSEREDIRSFLKEMQSFPRSLAEISRIQIRKHLDTNLPEKISTLDIPVIMREYLNIQELDSIVSDYQEREQIFDEEDKPMDGEFLRWSLMNEGQESSDDEEFDFDSTLQDNVILPSVYEIFAW